MEKIKVLSVFGTRPEAIKMCPLVKLLEKDERIDAKVCVTAQHREMLDSVLDIFDVKPDFDLNIMAHGQTIIDICNKVLTGVDKVLKEFRPDIVLVHGDTSTTLNGALAAFYNKVPVGHVEAGLRTGDMYSPFPEEANRKLTGAIATLHFAPTESNEVNLAKEGIVENVFRTGNTVIDALLSVINKEHKFENEELNKIDFNNNKVILLTAHRRENWGEPMKEIFKAVNELVIKNDDVDVVYCVPAIDIVPVVEAVKGTNVKVGAENMYVEEKGAYTGEIAPAMLVDAGVSYVIIGHSERRDYFKEDDAFLNKKVLKAFEHGLTPILCCGESLEQRETGVTMDWIRLQIKSDLVGVTADQVKSMVIAYEPIWAIGTGKTATTEQAQEVCKGIRDCIEEMYDTDTAAAVRIQYGGSVNAGNAAELFAQPDIDGGLVGGASLKADFGKIVCYK